MKEYIQHSLSKHVVSEEAESTRHKSIINLASPNTRTPSPIREVRDKAIKIQIRKDKTKDEETEEIKMVEAVNN
jgi:hypothetical protein